MGKSRSRVARSPNLPRTFPVCLLSSRLIFQFFTEVCPPSCKGSTTTTMLRPFKLSRARCTTTRLSTLDGNPPHAFSTQGRRVGS